MVIISPMLSVAGFYQKPFQTVAEHATEIDVSDGEETIRGRVDVLVMDRQLWVAIVEAKGPQFSWMVGLPQILVYMASDTQARQHRFGLITNGTELVFVKLKTGSGEGGKYALSRIFSLHNPGNDLYDVVGVLKSVGKV